MNCVVIDYAQEVTACIEECAATVPEAAAQGPNRARLVRTGWGSLDALASHHHTTDHVHTTGRSHETTSHSLRHEKNNTNSTHSSISPWQPQPLRPWPPARSLWQHPPRSRRGWRSRPWTAARWHPVEKRVARQITHEGLG